MLNGGKSEEGRQAGLAHDGLRWSGVHASDFNPGFVTYRRGHGAENMVVGSISDVQLAGFVTSVGIAC